MYVAAVGLLQPVGFAKTRSKQSQKSWVVVCLLVSICWFLSSGPARAQDITTGLVGHWKLDDGSGLNAADSSGNGNTGTLTNGPTWTTGQVSGAVDFDGTNDYVNTADIDVTTALTISVWMKSDVIPGAGVYEDLVTRTSGSAVVDGDYWLELIGDEIEFGFCNSVYRFLTTTSANLVAGSWYHIVGVFSDSANTFEIYVNGSLSLSGAQTNSILTNNETVKIGAGFTGEYFDGQIDDVRIYSRALTAADVAALYVYTGTCSNPSRNSGVMVYNATSNVMQYCNGTTWKAMGPVPGAGGVGCSNPSRNAGVVVYNSDFNVMQYCDGARWKAMGPVPGTGGAGCSNPAGSAGGMVYNTTSNVVQYCDGANWVQVGNP